MSSKFVLLLAFVTAVVGAEINCDCNNDDTKELWEYLTKISQDFDDLTDEEKEMYSVVPGFLSPLFECNCLNDRRKRSIAQSIQRLTPLETTSTSRSPQEEKSGEVEKTVVKPRRKQSATSKIRYSSRSCPFGYVRIVYWCVPEEKLD